MKYLKDISLYIVIAFVVAILSDLIGSTFLFKYLKENIIGLLLTLLAINTATLGLIASKIQDVLLTLKLDFSGVTKEMKISLLEQVLLIAFSIIILSVDDSMKICFENKGIVMDTLLVGVLLYAINILWDTGKGVFVIIDEIQKLNNNDKSDHPAQ